MTELAMPADGEYGKHHQRIHVPWAMIWPHNEQAKLNHGGQDLFRLRQRGGLSPCEALAILDDRPWRKMGADESYNELKLRVQQFGEHP